jgi:hypothetical protein
MSSITSSSDHFLVDREVTKVNNLEAIIGGTFASGAIMSRFCTKQIQLYLVWDLGDCTYSQSSHDDPSDLLLCGMFGLLGKQRDQVETPIDRSMHLAAGQCIIGI